MLTLLPWRRWYLYLGIIVVHALSYSRCLPLQKGETMNTIPSNYHTSKSLGASEYLPARNGISPFSTFPPSFSAPFFSLPALVIFFFPVLALETRGALHEGYLAFVGAFNPLVYTLVAVYKTSWRCCWCYDRGGADRA